MVRRDDAAPDGLRSIIPLRPESLRGVEPAAIAGEPPTFETVDPSELFVEEGYQRGISRLGVTLVRKIYAGFDWSRFKPPVCVRLREHGDVLVCIDGQHTATAAATHPAISKIPVMIVSASTGDLRAGAFVGHNRDRLALTAQAVYRAELAGGDRLACAVDRACRAAGATILEESINLRDEHPVGSTIAIGTLKAVARRQGEDALAAVLRVLVAAKRGPIKAAEVSAVALILAHHPEAADRLGKVVGSQTAEAWAAIGIALAVSSRDALGPAIAKSWCRELDLRLAGRLSAGRGAHRLSAVPPKAKTAPVAPLPKTPPVAAKAPPVAPKAAPAAPVAPEPQKRASEAQNYGTIVEQSRGKPIPGLPQVPGQTVERNGVVIDLRTREVYHRGGRAVLLDAGIRLIAALLRVMPATLDRSHLAPKAFAETAKADHPERLRELIRDTNDLLRPARLEVFAVGKIGHMLRPSP